MATIHPETVVTAAAGAYQVLVCLNVHAQATEQPGRFHGTQLRIRFTADSFDATAILSEDRFFVIEL